MQPTTRDELISAIADRRTDRVIHDAAHSTSQEEEIKTLVVRNVPLEQMTNAELLAIWGGFDTDEDAEGYLEPILDLTDLRKGATPGVDKLVREIARGVENHSENTGEVHIVGDFSDVLRFALGKMNAQQLAEVAKRFIREKGEGDFTFGILTMDNPRIITQCKQVINACS